MARIRVIYKPTGQAGSVDDSEFNPQIYQMADAQAPAAPQPPAAPPPQPIAPSPAPVAPQQPQGGGLLANIGRSIIQPGIDAGKAVLGTGFEAVRKADYLLGNKDAYDVQKGKINPFETRDQAVENSAHPIKTALKTAAQVGSYIAPAGKAGSAASIIGHGAVQGGLFGAAQGQGLDPKEIAKNAILGAGTGGLLYGAGKAIGAAGGKVAEKLANTVFKEPLKDTKAAVKVGETLGKQALDRGEVGTTEGIHKGALSKIQTLEDTLQQKLVNSNATIGKDEVVNSVKPLVDEYTRAGNTTAAKSITDRIESIAAENGDQIPVSAANQIKRTLYDEANKAYGTEASAGMEGVKQIARGLKEAIAKKVPGVDQVNKNLSYYGRLRDSMTDLLARSERNNVVGLSDIGVGGLGGLFGGGAPGAVAAIGAKKFLGSTVGKTLEAQALNKTSGLTDQVLTNPLAIRGAQSGVENVANAISQPQGLPNTPQSLVPQAQAAGLPPTDQMNTATVPAPQAAGGLPEQPNLTTPVSGYSTQKLYQAYYKALAAGRSDIATQIKTMADTQAGVEKDTKSITTKPDQINPHSVTGQGLLDAATKDILKPDGKINRQAIIGLYLPGQSVLGANLKSLVTQIVQSQTTSGRLPTPEQLKEAEAEYVPKWNESDDVIRQKLQNAQAALENVKYTKPTLDLLDQQP